MSDDNEIVFYHNPFSRGRIAHWMLEEVGVPYRTVILDFNKGDHKSADFVALNPMGKIPTIVHRGVVVTEAAAVCAYLADAFPAARLAPGMDDPARGTYLRWLFFAAGTLEQALADRAFPRVERPRESSIGYGSYEDTLDALEKALTPGPFILGETFSAADVYVGSQIAWGLMIKTLEARPRFQEYVGRFRERPAAQRAGARDREFGAQVKPLG